MRDVRGYYPAAHLRDFWKRGHHLALNSARDARTAGDIGAAAWWLAEAGRCRRVICALPPRAHRVRGLSGRYLTAGEYQAAVQAAAGIRL